MSLMDAFSYSFVSFTNIFLFICFISIYWICFYTSLMGFFLTLNKNYINKKHLSIFLFYYMSLVKLIIHINPFIFLYCHILFKVGNVSPFYRNETEI